MLTDVARMPVLNKRIYTIIEQYIGEDNDRYIVNAENKTRAMWRIINKELGNNPKREVGKDIKYGTWKGSNLKDVAERYNSYFTEIIGKLVKQNNGSRGPQEINSCSETVYLSSDRN
jgi:hypothetical protein